jgi:hypothetical protein
MPVTMRFFENKYFQCREQATYGQFLGTLEHEKFREIIFATVFERVKVYLQMNVNS